MRIYTWFIITNLLFYGCESTKNERRPDSDIISKNLLSIMDSITSDTIEYRSNEKKILVYTNYPDSSLAYCTKKYLAKTSPNRDSIMIKGLSLNVRDTILISSAHLIEDKRTKLILEESLARKYLTDSAEKVFGVFKVTPVSFDKEKNKGVFYIDIQCGRNCGTGNLVFIDKEGEYWDIEKIEKCWH